MRTKAQAVVIGGGAMGVSLMYHLAARGWTNSVLLEKTELTAGSTWHAAGLCTHFAHNATIMAMRARSVRLYRDILPEETGLATGFHATGALRVTRSADRMDEFAQVCGLGRFVGHELNLLTPEELAEMYPLCVIDGLLGAIHEPNDGHVDPTLATQAMAAGARARGAEIRRHSPVEAIERCAGGWRVVTATGILETPHVINAAGTWCREIGAMMGLDLPIVPMLHQYVVTDTVPEIAARVEQGLPELPIIRDPEESWYLRQERDGFILGPYERDAAAWGVDGIPPQFGADLMPPDLDRIEPIMLAAMERVPAAASAGLKRVINGPITFTPDGNPLIGPAFGLDGAWLLTGSSMGVMEGGGAGAFLADWIVDGAPPMDALATDPRRFGDWADRTYRLDRAHESFGLQFGIHFPHEEREAGRPRRTTPILERQRAAGAVFGVAHGWERPLYFGSAPGRLTFRKPDWLDAVGAECLAVRDAAGLFDLSAFAKFEVTGPDALAFAESLGANRAPRRDGRIGLTHALTPAGGVASEFTVTRLSADRIYLTSAAAAERHDHDLLRVRARGHDVAITNRTEALGILAVTGPRARAILTPLADADLSNTAFPWLSAVEMSVAGIAVRALRVSFAGELGWELHVPMNRLGALHDSLTQAGPAHGLRPAGTYALNALRLEKGYRAWGADLTTERTPLEAGLDALVRAEGRTFIGREAMLGRADPWRMELLELACEGDLLPHAAHAVMQECRPVGIVTSGAYGHRVSKMLALAYLRPGVVAPPEGGAPLTVDLLGTEVAVEILAEPPYDPRSQRQRAAAGARVDA